MLKYFTMEDCHLDKLPLYPLINFHASNFKQTLDDITSFQQPVDSLFFRTATTQADISYIPAYL